MHDIEWRWADPSGQQRRIRLDELRAALAGGVVAPNAPVWRAGWPQWIPARDVPELQSSALSAQNGLLPNIPPPPLAVVAAQSAFEAQSGPSQSAAYAEPPAPPHYVPLAPAASLAVHGVLPSSPVSAPPTTVPLPPGSGPKLHDPSKSLTNDIAKSPASAPKVEPAPEPPVAAAPVAPVAGGPAPKIEASEKPPEVAAAPASAPRSAPRSAEKVTSPPRASTQIGMPAFTKDRPSQKLTRPEIATPAVFEPSPATTPLLGQGAADGLPSPTSIPPDELSWSSLELTDDTGAHPVVDIKKAPPLPAEARRASGLTSAVRGSTPPPPHARPSAPPAMIAAGLTRPSSPPPTAQGTLAEEMSSSALLLDDSSSYSYVSPRTLPPKAPSIPPKAPSMPPPARPVPSRPPPPPVPLEELSSSLLEADASGAFPLDPPRLAAMLRNSSPVEELSSSVLTSADSTSAIPIVPAAAIAQAAAANMLLTPAASPVLAAALPTPPPTSNGAAASPGASIPTSLFGSPSPLVAPVAAPATPAAPVVAAVAAIAAVEPAAAPAAAEPSLFGRRHTPTSLDAVGGAGLVAAPAGSEGPQASASVPTSLFGTPSPLLDPSAPDGGAPPVTKSVPPVQGAGAPPPSSNGPSSGISVPTSMGIGLPAGEVASHPVVVPPPANRPTSDAAAYFERADKDEARAPSAPEPETQEDMLEGLVAPSPLERAKKALAPMLARMKTLSEEENRYFLPGIVAASTVFTFLFLGVVFAASSDGAPPATTVATSTPHPSAEASSAVPATTAPPKAVASAVVPPPPPVEASVSCKLSGDPVPVAEKTSIAAGIEVIAQDGMTAIGYASAPKEGQLVRLGEGLAATPAGRLKMGEPIRRVQPLIHKGKLEMAVEIDKKILGMTSRRSVVHDPPFDIGIVGAAIGHASHLRNGEKELFAVPGEGPIDALRVAPTSGAEKGVAVAFRRAGGIYVGVAIGDDLAPKGDLQKASGTGEKVGSPAIAVSDGQWLAAFADRTGDVPWGLRVFGAKVGGTATPAKSFTPPAGGPGGGTISPSLLPLGSGAFLLTWTEGPEKGHQVRAQVLDASGDPSGAAFAVSPAGTDAGQARGAIDASGKGVLAYFAAKEEGYRLVAVPLSCGK